MEPLLTRIAVALERIAAALERQHHLSVISVPAIAPGTPQVNARPATPKPMIAPPPQPVRLAVSRQKLPEFVAPTPEVWAPVAGRFDREDVHQ